MINVGWFWICVIFVDITISGLVSGLNSNEGLVNTLVKGNGIINGTDQKMTGTMYGVASGKGNSTLVGASSIVSNQSSSAGGKNYVRLR